MSLYKLKEKFGDKVRVFSFEGSKRPEEIKGFPRKVGEYNTVVYGWLIYFVPGEEKVIDNGVVYHRIYESYTPGNPHVPSYYRAVYATEEVVDEVKKALK